MKVLPFKIPKPDYEALVYQEDHEAIFCDQLHQHEEIQISYIVNGTGTLLLADSVISYVPGNILVIGSNVPHVFKSDSPVEVPSFMKSLFFKRDSFGSQFFDLEETSELATFFENSRMGMQVLEYHKEITEVFDKMPAFSKLDRLLGLFQILKLIAIGEVKLLSNGTSNHHFSPSQGQRLRKVFEYTMTHYQRQISLEEIASVANMTRNAFCKYFKKRTNKTYVQFLNELRVEMVVKALKSNSEVNISEIAYKCGFRSISNFNRTFRKIKNLNPKYYLEIKSY